VGRLDLESLRTPSSTSLLELPALRSNERLSSLEGSTEVLDGLPDVPLSPQQNGVATGRSPQSELVQGQSLTTVGDDPVPGGSGEAQGGDGELADLGETLVVEDLSDNNDGLGTVGVLALGLLDDSRDGDRGSVDPGHKEPLEDGPVEPRVGPSGEESVELDQQEEVGVLTLGSGSVALPDVVVLNVDTHLFSSNRIRFQHNIIVRWSRRYVRRSGAS